jgi:hypothetical protein
MAGALMQLVAYGAQDVYLTGNPQITFFKVVYRRHTNFAMESMEQALTGTANYGNKVTCKIARNGDLVGATYLEATLGGAGDGLYKARPGFAMIKNVELRIGGQKIDRQSGVWMDVWSELTSTFDQTKMLDGLVGCRDQLATGATSLASGLEGGANDTQKVHVPFQFSFCRNPGLALPLIALQYHEVELIVEFNPKTSVENSGGLGVAGTAGNLSDLSNVSLWCDYIFLDTEERKNFAQNPHEYLIETVQENTDTVTTSSTDNLKLTFNHPVKELVWTYGDSNSFGTYNNGANPCDSAILKLNGQDRFSSRNGTYFNTVQPYQHHTGNPAVGINAYSFALKPEEHQPSGTCNFSRIDNAELSITNGALATGQTQLNVFAHSYNVLRVASGMGGIAYSN